ncbi:hypothetical protein AKJ16_DCAP15775 [Drosera capensis]
MASLLTSFAAKSANSDPNTADSTTYMYISLFSDHPVLEGNSYCSNLYPKAETYRVCNWCLIEAAGNNDHKKTTSNSTNLSPCTARSEGDNKGNHGTRQVDALVKKKKSPVGSTSGGLKQKTTTVVAGNCGKGDGMMRMLRRTQSDVAAKRDGMANTAVVVNRVFRGKVRRYKLLNEVTS